MQYFIRSASGERGPLPADEVALLARSGRLQPDDLIRADHEADWRPAWKVRGYVRPAPESSAAPAQGNAQEAVPTPRFGWGSLVVAGIVGCATAGAITWAIMFAIHSGRQPVTTNSVATPNASPSIASQVQKPEAEARHFLEIRDPRAAEERYDQLSRLVPDKAAHWVDLGRIRFDQKNLVGAKLAFAAALMINSSNYAALEGVGDVALAQGNAEQAVRAWEAASSIAPLRGGFGVSGKLLLVYRDAGLWDKAVPLAEKLVAKADGLAGEPDASKMFFHLMLADTYKQAGQVPKAQATYEAVLSKDAGNDQALVGLTLCLGLQNQFQRAGELISKVNPPTAGSLFALAQLRVMKDDFEGAAVALRASLALDAKPPERWVALAGIENPLGNFDAALVAIDKAMELETPDPNARLLRATILVNAKRHWDAFEELVKAEAGGADSEDVLRLRARALVGMGRQDQAIEILQRLLRENPNTHDALSLVLLLLDREDWLAAADVYELLGRIEPGDAVAHRESQARMHFMESLRLKQADNLGGQIRELRTAVEIHPSVRNKSQLALALSGKARAAALAKQFDAARGIVAEIRLLDAEWAMKLERLIDDGERLDRDQRRRGGG